MLSDGPGASRASGSGPRSRRRWFTRAACPCGPHRRCWFEPRGVGRPGETVLAVANALRGELYAAAYRFEGAANRRAARTTGLPAGGAGGRAASPSDRLVGEAPPPAGAALERLVGATLVGPPEGAPHARVLLDLMDSPAVPPGLRTSPRGSRSMADRPKPRLAGRRRMDAPYRIRSAVPADAGRLVAIERRASATRGARAAFGRRSRRPGRSASLPTPARGVAGYLIGREVAGTGEVLNLAVAPNSAGAASAARCSGRVWLRSVAGRWMRCFSKCASPTSRRRRSTSDTASGRSGSGRRTTATRVRTRWCCGSRWNSARERRAAVSDFAAGRGRLVDGAPREAYTFPGSTVVAPRQHPRRCM